MTKKWNRIIASALLLVLGIAAWCFFDNTCLILNGRIYSRSAVEVVLTGRSLPDHERLLDLPELEVLDIRQIEVRCDEYDELRAVLPDCTILWKVPFGDDRHDDTAKEVVVTSLTEDDLDNLRYLTNLETVDARGCRDYRVLQLLSQSFPDLTVMYTVSVGGQELRENATEVQIADGEAEQLLSVLPMLTQLETVDALACSDYETLAKMYKAYPQLDVRYTVTVGGKSYPGDTTSLVLENADAEELMEKLPYLPALTDVALTGTTPENDLIYEMMCLRPDVVFNWEFELFGVKTSSTATELDLSNIPMESTDIVEDALKYFYNLERVEMCDCGIPSVAMDALARRHPETRFVWTIHIGTGSLRTDATAFIPYKVGHTAGNPISEEEAWELRYCIDLICLDLGHMRMEDISFLYYMPKLQYLVLADTEVESYAVLSELTELVYLELFSTSFTDVEILLNLTKLEDLNISWTNLENPELLMEMTWLKRLWATEIGLTEEQNQKLKEALPDTLVYTKSLHPTEGGWRQSKRYYEMRDLLEMHYMQ